MHNFFFYWIENEKKKCWIKLNAGSNFWTNQHFTQLKSKSGKRIFFGIFKYLFGCQIIWKMRVLYFFLKTCFFFTTHLIFFSRPAWTDIDINIALNFCGKKDDSPLWVRRRLNIFMNYSLKILFATNCKACDLANCLWLLIEDSFRASKIKLDANVPTIIVNYGKLKSPKITGW